MCPPQSLKIFFSVNSQKRIFQEVDFHDLGNWKKELCFFLILSMILGQRNFKQKLTSTQLAISSLGYPKILSEANHGPIGFRFNKGKMAYFS